MPSEITRRRLLALGASASVLATIPVSALAEPVLGDVVLGKADAPVTVIEYFSYTCPHCANFHQNTWPRVKSDYIDTGKVRFIFRDVYFDRYGLWASMTARCGGDEGFFPMTDQFLKQQKVWLKSEDIAGAIQKIGRLNGLSADQLRSCLSDQDYAKALVTAYQNNAEADGVNSTPTFLINGTKHNGNLPFEDFAKLLDAEL